MKKWFIKHQFILIITGIAILVIGGISLFAWLILSNNEVVEGEHYTPTGEYALLDLGSTNCSPCIRLQPVLADLREEYGETIDIVFFDITNTQEGAAMANGYIRVEKAEYIKDEKTGEETVIVTHINGYTRNRCVTADSLLAMVQDVIKGL